MITPDRPAYEFYLYLQLPEVRQAHIEGLCRIYTADSTGERMKVSRTNTPCGGYRTKGPTPKNRDPLNQGCLAASNAALACNRVEL